MGLRAAVLSAIAAAGVLLGAAPARGLDLATPRVEAESFWNQGYTGDGVEIGVIDLYQVSGTHPALADNFLGAVKFSGGGSVIGEHATEVAGAVASLDATYTGVAPGAGIWSAQTANRFAMSSQRIQTTAAESFAQGLGTLSGNAVEVLTLSIYLNGSSAGTDQWSLGLDHVVDTEGCTIAVAAGNDGPAGGTISGYPTGAYNVILVGATGGTGGYASENYDNMAYYSSRGPTDDGRAAPDIVAPGSIMHLPTTGGGWDDVNGTSFATPMVAGGAALLIDMGLDLGYSTDPRVIKATLLNSAEKLSGWTHTPTQPLDYNQGAGQMNLQTAYDQYAPGEHDPGPASLVGWDDHTVDDNAQNFYSIGSRLAAGELFSATLAWDRIISTDTEDIDDVIYSVNYLANLDLHLYAADDLTTPIASSVSAIDNVEHLYLSVPQTGRYVLGVEMTGAVPGGLEHYGLAWHAVAAPPLVGDFNEDDLVDGVDVQLLWDSLGGLVPPTDARFDLVADGLVDLADATELVASIIGTSMADTDLDFEVGLEDLGNLAAAYKQPGDFAEGDTNADGFIDLLDLGNLANDYGLIFTPPVPEPTSLALLVPACVVPLGRRRVK